MSATCAHCGKPIVYGPTEDREPHWRHRVPITAGANKGLFNTYVGCRLSAEPTVISAEAAKDIVRRAAMALAGFDRGEISRELTEVVAWIAGQT